MLSFNPYAALGGVGLFIAATTGAFFEGKHVAQGEAAREKLGQLVQALNERDAKQKQIDQLEKAATQREQDRQVEVRNVYTEIPKLIDRPVYRNVCVDGDGVRLLDRAQAAAGGHAGLNPGAPVGQASGSAGDSPHH